MQPLAARTIQKTGTSTILQRIAGRDKTAVKDCIDTYGNFIWALARKFTASRVEAEVATEEIFIDIWQYREGERDIETIEKKLIALIALRRLIKSPRCAENKSAKLNCLSEKLDEIVVSAFHRDFTDASEIRALITEDELPAKSFISQFSTSVNEIADSCLSYLLGTSLGRWDIRFATGEKSAP
jgi:DNA-directed RNA polymerase specialized sigma24 family protein